MMNLKTPHLTCAAAFTFSLILTHITAEEEKEYWHSGAQVVYALQTSKSVNRLSQ